MCVSIVHRGPDDQNIYVDRNIGLGSRRLAIIDLVGGQQPIHNEDKTIWVVLNGEIYNYPDLRHTLLRRGHIFYTHSDTETIVHAYEEFGDDCINHLNGMFAFALWDGRRQRLFVARDRMGIKPMYYCESGNGLIFGSEIKAILAYPSIDRRIDLVALNEYLSFEYVPSPRSIFQNIKKLPPAHAMEYRDGNLHVWRYWDLNLAKGENTPRKRIADVEQELLKTLGDSIRKEMISDVPVGVLLSGGIDSSAVAALMRQVVMDEIHSFSITFDDPSFDESYYARLAAQHIGTTHHELRLTPQMMIDLVPRIPEFLDEPLGDSSIVPTFLVSQFTRQFVKVALGGDGGDELFCGYSTFQAHRLADYYEQFAPGFFKDAVMNLLTDHLPTSFDNISFDFKVKRFVSGRGLHPAIRHHQWIGSYTPVQRKSLLQGWAQINEHDTYQVVFDHLRACSANEFLNQMLYLDMKLYLEGGMLVKVDRASMANSLEVRVPLLNHTLVEYVSGLPHDIKLRGLTTKYILRRTMKGKVPDIILRRGKKGFNMPVAKWLTGALRPLAEEMFSEKRLNDQGLFEARYVGELMNEHLTGRRDHRKLLWTLLSFQLWHERWSQSKSAASP